MNMKNLLIITVIALITSLCANAQTARTIHGVVSDEIGEPLPGANVVVKGQGAGTSTDIEGRFTLTVPSNGKVLVVSYLGYETIEIPINKQTFDIRMKTLATELDELVVVGYGVRKKSDLTGAISSVSAERIASVGTSSLMAALQGANPGVDIQTSSTRPGASFTMKIRGQNSINSGNPLFVVDGIVVSDIDYLNPNDIEKIDILKDASSTAIYGSRGSNGVVVVQTKNAQNVTSRLSISYDGFTGTRQLARIPDFMDGREWIDYRTSMYYTWNATKGVYELTSSNQAAVTQNSKLVHTALYEEDYTDWLDLGTQDGKQQSHSLNINGQSGDISYNASIGYQTEDGNFLLEKLDRYNMKGSVDHKANKYFSSGVNIMLSHQVVNTGSQYGYRDLLRIPVVLKAYRDNGELIDQPGIKAEIDGDGNFTSAANPITEIQSGSNEPRRFDVLGSLYAQLTPLDGLSLKSTISPRLRRVRTGYYREKNSNRTVNQAQTSNTENFDYTWDNVLNFSRKFAEKHNVNLTLIHSMYKTTSETLAVYAENFPYDSQWYNIFNGEVKSGSSSSGYSQTTLLSYAARLNYDYEGKYLLTGTIRYDGSSKLANKWAAFPSAAVAWRISEEDFVKDNVQWLSNLKARLSFGYSGNNNGVSAYGTQVSPNTSSNVYYDFGGSAVTGFATGTPVNTALTWEKTRELDFGLDFGILKGRLSGSIDLYDKLSEGLLMSRSLTWESGVASMTDNIGSVSNKGIEVSLNAWIVRSRDFEWNTVINYAYNKNAIVSLYGKKEDVIGEARFIGEPINVIYDYKVNGLYTQAEWAALSEQQRKDLGATSPGYPKTIDIDGDGVLTTDDRIILGQVDPKWTGGLTSNMRFRGFDFSFNIYTRQGTMINDAFLQEFSPDANNQRGRPKINLDYYIPGGVPRFDWSQEFTTDASGQKWAVWGTSTETTNATHPTNSFRGSFYGSNGSYQDASFIKVRNITLGYSLPKSLIAKAYLTQARIYFNVLNPFTFTDYIGWDPEYATTSLQNGNGPSSITYQVGVNLKF